MRKILVLSLVLGLAACGSPRATDYSVVAAYDGALKAAIAYGSLPRCDLPTSPPICSDPAKVVKMAKAAVVAQPSVNALLAVGANTKSTDSDLAVAEAAAQAAVQAFTQTVTTLTGSK